MGRHRVGQSTVPRKPLQYPSRLLWNNVVFVVLYWVRFGALVVMAERGTQLPLSGARLQLTQRCSGLICGSTFL